ncbi:integrase core domain-containing protein [Streptomyces sp. EN27]|uniref:integrase core domain-containing protein n=1 Tax=Streptomyces sp. EN27 TaxID=211464 RepID=UPI00159EF94C
MTRAPRGGLCADSVRPEPVRCSGRTRLDAFCLVARGRPAPAGAAHKKIRPYRPRTSGKAERFHRTLAAEGAYQRPRTPDNERQAAFPDGPDRYDCHRPHTGPGGQSPAGRVTSLSEQHTYDGAGDPSGRSSGPGPGPASDPGPGSGSRGSSTSCSRR